MRYAGKPSDTGRGTCRDIPEIVEYEFDSTASRLHQIVSLLSNVLCFCSATFSARAVAINRFLFLRSVGWELAGSAPEAHNPSKFARGYELNMWKKCER